MAFGIPGHRLTANGSRHSWRPPPPTACTLSRGIRQGPSRLQAKDRKSSKASQSTPEASDHQGGDASTMRARAGGLGDARRTKPPGSGDAADLFLRSI